MIRFKWFNFGGEESMPEAQNEAAESAEPVTMPGHPNGQRVLIVDDDKVFVRATSMRLCAAGFQVVAAKDGAEAIERLRDTPAHAILMDIDFPPDVCNGGMGSWDGFQIMSWLRGLPTSRGARFIIVSNTDSPEYRARATKLGAVAFLKKPLQNDQLLTAINPANGTPVISASI